MAVKVINRDASDKTTGFRLQKLRAIQIMLERLLDEPENLFWCCIEKEADVAIASNNQSGELEKELEEDKNYGLGNQLTFNSSAILNTLVINIDSLHQFDFNPKSLFTFYTSANYTKEGKSEFTKENELSFPEEAVLPKLYTTINGQKTKEYGTAFEDDKLIELLSKIVINEYERQYKAKSFSGNLESIKRWDLENWKDFLKRVKFFFGEPDYQEIYPVVEKLVTSLPYYNADLIGKEGLIISSLLEEVENTQFLPGTSKGFVSNKNIELIYEKIKNGSSLPVDPSWVSWEKIDNPKDLRNIEEKVRAVIHNPDNKFLERINRRAANGLAKTQEHDGNKSLKAVLYIIYDCCEEELSELIRQKQSMTEAIPPNN